MEINKEYTSEKVDSLIEKYSEMYPGVAIFICSSADIVETLWNNCINDIPFKKAKIKQYMDKKVAHMMRYFKNFEIVVSNNEIIFFNIEIVNTCCIIINPDIFNSWQDDYNENSDYSDDNFLEAFEEILKQSLGHYIAYKENGQLSEEFFFNPEGNTVFFNLEDSIEEIYNSDFEKKCSEVANVDREKFIKYKKILAKVRALNLINKAYNLINITEEDYKKITERFDTLDKEIEFANCIYKVLSTKYKKRSTSEIIEYIFDNFGRLSEANFSDLSFIKF